MIGLVADDGQGHRIRLGDRLGRVLGSRVITSAGSLTVEADGSPFAFLALPSVFAQQAAPQITISGRTISWAVPGFGGTLIWGVY